VLSGLSNEVMIFGEHRLDPAERRLTRSGEPVELSGRYLDALVLLASHPGQLVTKERFMGDVWCGVPVTDEALTQCIRSLRKALGDEIARPRFIETVPKHGYRFIADVTRSSERPSDAQVTEKDRHPPLLVARKSYLLLTAACTAGGAAAGLVGGIAYGLMAADAPPPGTGAISILLVMTCVCLLVGLLGGLGVGAGIAAARQLPGERLFPLMAGGAFGGLAVGALGRLIGLDAFALLIGSRPEAITGASEGMLIGALAGAAAWFALRRPAPPLEQVALFGTALGAAAGLLVAAGGGQMMAGSLATLAAAPPGAPLGALLTSQALPPLLLWLTSAIEGAVFVGAVSLALAILTRADRARS
jgi:DNA-binding winged helix-turn-helix (wHTH) protein